MSSEKVKQLRETSKKLAEVESKLLHNYKRIETIESYQVKLKEFVQYLDDLTKNINKAKKLTDEHIKISGEGFCTDNLENIYTSLCSISGTVFSYNIKIATIVSEYEQQIEVYKQQGNKYKQLIDRLKVEIYGDGK